MNFFSLFSPLSRIAGLILIFMVLTSILAPWISPYDPFTLDMTARLIGPSNTHLLGTDSLGRDFLSRLLHGGRISMALAFALTASSLTLGLVAGLISGYFRGTVDTAITGITTIFLGLPGLTLMIAIAGMMGPGIVTIAVALTLTGWTAFSRIVRAEVIRVSQSNYMDISRAMGAGNFHLICRHILPGLGPLCLVTFTTRVSRAMITISSLTYLGFGIEPPVPDWGGMIREAVFHFRTAPHLILGPGAALFLFTFSVNLIGDALREGFDVH